MNATKAFSSAMNLAQKPAAIGFATIFGLAISTILVTGISTLLTLLIPVFATATKAAIYGYPLFLAGVIVVNIKQQYQTKEAPTIAILPPGKPCKRLRNQTEAIENEVLITPLSDEVLLIYSFFEESHEQTSTEIQEATEEDKTSIKPDIKPLSSQLATQIICWQAISNVSEKLSRIKASELKSIASEFVIPKYRNMNKAQLLVEIMQAYENAPAFSQ